MKKYRALSIVFCFISGFMYGEVNKNQYTLSSLFTDSLPVKKDTIAAAPNACAACHANIIAKKNTHNPKTGKACDDCHSNSTVNHPAAKIATLKIVPDLCLSCHDDTKELISSSKYAHQAVTDAKSCLSCHTPHSTDEKKLLIAGRKELCLSCHNKTIATKQKSTINYDRLMKSSKTLHPPFEDCEKTCHNPHASNNRHLLDVQLATNNYVPAVSDSFALCWECHGSDMIEKPKSKGASNFRNDETNLHYVHVHGDKSRNCMMCHNPHATNTSHLIREKVKFGSWEFQMNYKSDENGGSCTPACHGEKKYVR